MKHGLHIREITREEHQQIEVLYGDHEDSLKEYAELLLWWNKKINLVSRDVSHETLAMHIRHSLMIRLSEFYTEGPGYIDTGTGGGLPGLPLALTSSECFRLNDIVVKKTFALNDMIQKLGLKERVKSIAGSIEHVEPEEDEVVITKHAFKVPELLAFCRKKSWERFIFLKGSSEAEEEIGKEEGISRADILRLDAPFMEDFYNGKAVVSIYKQKVHEKL